MKESNITNVLIKTKMSGYEVGRLMIQSYLYGLKQIYDGVKDIKDLLSPQETQYTQDQLNDSKDIKIYNSCRRLWMYLEHASSMASITKKEMEVIALKLYFVIANEIKAESLRCRLCSGSDKGIIKVKPGQELDSVLGLINFEYDDSKDETVLDLYGDFIALLKQWLIFQEMFSIVSERMELPDIMLLIREEPAQQVKLVNALLRDIQFLFPDNQISIALIDNGLGINDDTDIIEIEKLKPTNERISAAREATRDLTYFMNNWGIHSILGLEANNE